MSPPIGALRTLCQSSVGTKSAIGYRQQSAERPSEDTKDSFSPAVEPTTAVLTDASPTDVPTHGGASAASSRTKRKRTEQHSAAAPGGGIEGAAAAAATSESLPSFSTTSGGTPTASPDDASRVIKRARCSNIPNNMVAPSDDVGIESSSRGGGGGGGGAQEGSGSSGGGGPSQLATENQTTLWIGDLERWEDEEHLFRFFDRLAPRGVLSVKIARDREQQRSLGFGFVDFASREIAERILLSAPSVKRPHGRKLKLSWAKGKTRQPFNPVMASGGSSGSGGPPSSSSSAAAAAVAGSAAITSGSSHVRLNWPSSGGGGMPYRHHLEPQSSSPEWYLKLTHCPKGTEAQQLCDEVLRPSGYGDGVSHVNTLTRGTYTEATVFFTTSDWFFAFLQQFPEGRVQCGRFCGFIEVPQDVMEKWTRLYESVTRM